MTAVFILAFAALLSAEPSSADEIASYVERVDQRIASGDLVSRTVEYTHATIPGIGQPSNSITCWFEQEHTMEHLLEIPVMIENRYRWAGFNSSAVFYYDASGNPVCCRSATETWQSSGTTIEDTFFFHEGEPLMYLNPLGEKFFELDEELLAKAEARLRNAEILLRIFDSYIFPEPALFREQTLDG